jgi:polysaccharide biosynthesis protein PslH
MDEYCGPNAQDLPRRGLSASSELRVLFLCARFPYPPYKGDQARAYHQIRLLARRHRISLLSFVDAAVTPELVRRVRPLVEDMTLVPLGPRRMAMNLAQRLPTAMPWQTAMFSDRRMRLALRECLEAARFDLVHVQLARMAPYLEGQRSLPRLIDLIDALSVNMARRAARERQPRRFLLLEESRRLRAYEHNVCDTYDAVTVVSESDRAAIGSRPNLFVNPNGVDLEVFRPRLGPSDPNRIIMTGNMSYFPNIDGLRWFTSHVLPAIQRRRPGITVHIVGVNPHRQIQQLAAANPAVRITGFVQDLAEQLASAAVAFVPLRSGSGMQFKVIEAMACGTPVVTTSFGIGGLSVVNGRDILVADEPAEFADAVCRLLEHPELRDRLARAGRRYVSDNFTWERIVSELEGLYTQTVSERLS